MLKSLRARTLCVAFLFSCTGLAAPSAADKATARDLATAGIQLFKDGKYEEALDKLKRAEELYDVPVHLLYIARAEEKLGQLVEAAETYRQLDHYNMPAGAPPAWVTAQEDGRKELPGVEPRVPKLKVQLEPRNAEGASLTIDGKAVPSAAIGAERPINPGKHHVEATAKGYKTASGDVEVAEKESKELSLALEKAPEGTVAATASGGAAAGTSAGEKKSGIGFLVGIRLGTAVPTGKIGRVNTGLGGTDEINVSDGFQPGASFELHAGIRIARIFTPHLFVEGVRYTPGGGILGYDVKNPSGASAGIGLIVGTPPGQMGGFGQIDIAVAHTLSVEAALPGNSQCKVSGNGPAVRFGGGGTFPVASWLNLTPFAMVTYGKPAELSSSGCGNVTLIEDKDLLAHAIIVLGVGGDIVFGKDR